MCIGGRTTQKSSLSVISLSKVNHKPLPETVFFVSVIFLSLVSLNGVLFNPFPSVLGIFATFVWCQSYDVEREWESAGFLAFYKRCYIRLASCRLLRAACSFKSNLRVRERFFSNQLDHTGGRGIAVRPTATVVGIMRKLLMILHVIPLTFHNF